MSIKKIRGLTVDEIIDRMPKTIPHSTVTGIKEHREYFEKLTQQEHAKLLRKK